jgi:CubicO group peptidase (beta-lactamase class C family)
VIVAVEKKATAGSAEASLHRFRDTQHEPFTRVLNEYTTQTVEAISGDPALYNLLVHWKGFPSLNHRMLTPTGQPTMRLANVWNELLSPTIKGTKKDGVTKAWAGYSNVNYAAIAMAIEAMWGGSLESFMKDILFEPLGMHSTSFGPPANDPNENKGWVVDYSGTPQEIQRPLYRADGAEAAALGAYSTAHDLDIFFKFIIDTFYQKQPIPEFDLSSLATALGMTFTTADSLRFTPLGLYTSVRSSVIGSLSTNRAQFPNEHFSKYNIAADEVDDDDSVYYMAGSAVACSCATAFRLGEKNSFAIVVLTNTSGPVDTADHILRLVLQRMFRGNEKGKFSSRLKQSIDVKEMVLKNKSEALRKWHEMELKHEQDLNCAIAVSKSIDGVFEGEGFDQRLVISTKANGKIYIVIHGPVPSPTQDELEIFWVDESSVKMHIPTHLSVDCLGQGDWANTVFKVEDTDHIVVTLIRTTNIGEDRFKRISSNV